MGIFVNQGEGKGGRGGRKGDPMNKSLQKSNVATQLMQDQETEQKGKDSSRQHSFRRERGERGRGIFIPGGMQNPRLEGGEFPPPQMGKEGGKGGKGGGPLPLRGEGRCFKFITEYFWRKRVQGCSKGTASFHTKKKRKKKREKGGKGKGQISETILAEKKGGDVTAGYAEQFGEGKKRKNRIPERERKKKKKHGVLEPKGEKGPPKTRKERGLSIEKGFLVLQAKEKKGGKGGRKAGQSVFGSGHPTVRPLPCEKKERADPHRPREKMAAKARLEKKIVF